MKNLEEGRSRLLKNSYLSILENKKYVIDVDELLHGAPRPIGQSYSRMKCLWSPWKALSDPDLLQILFDLSKNAIDSAEWDWKGFDIICSMSPTASPVASLLSLHYEKPLFYSDNRTLRILPEKPGKNDRVLLIDSLVSSGYHVYQMVGIFWPDEYFPEGYRRVNVFSFGFDDLIPKAQQIRLVNVWRQTGKLCYVYRLSELRDLWKAELERKPGEQHDGS